jgi:hypothetical protein
LVNLRGVSAQVCLDVFVMIPRLTGAMPELHKADSALEETPGDQGLAAVHVITVERSHRRGLLPDVKGVAGIHLHAIGEFKGLNARLQARVVDPLAKVLRVELAQQIELPALRGARGVRAADISR